MMTKQWVERVGQETRPQAFPVCLENEASLQELGLGVKPNKGNNINHIKANNSRDQHCRVTHLLPRL